MVRNFGRVREAGQAQKGKRLKKTTLPVMRERSQLGRGVALIEQVMESKMPVTLTVAADRLSLYIDALMVRQRQIFDQAYETMPDGGHRTVNPSAAQRYAEVTDALDELRGSADRIVAEEKARRGSR